jgi:DNA-binding response OmpR family regulator
MGSIAIYEPDDLMYALLREWLGGAGYAVRNSALSSDRNAGVDLVIVSVTMPRAESDALMRSVHRVHPGVPVIGLSSQARSGLCSGGAAARALGVQRVLAKPLTRGELLAAVHALIGPPGLS